MKYHQYFVVRPVLVGLDNSCNRGQITLRMYIPHSLLDFHFYYHNLLPDTPSWLCLGIKHPSKNSPICW